jgi:O-antigen ligase
LNAADAPALQVARIAAIGVAIGAALSPPLANLSAAVMIGAFFFTPDWRARVRRVYVSRLGKGVLVFIAALLLAAVVGAFSPQGGKAAFSQLTSWRTLLLMLVVFAVFDSARWKTHLAVAFVVFATVAALASLLVLNAGWHYKDLPDGVVLRNTVTQAITFAIGALLACVLLVTRPAASARERLLLGGALGLLLGQLVFVQVGRSGQVTLAILLFVAAALLLRGARRLLTVASLPLLAVAAFSVSPVLQARFGTAWNEMNNASHATAYTSMGMRVMMWHNTLDLIRERPILGYGLNGLEPAYAAHIKDRESGWKAIVTDDPHNQFLAVWVEAGLIGLVAFLFLIVAAWRQPAPDPWRPAALALLAAWCVTSFVSSHFQTFNEGHLIALFLGAFLAPAGARDAVPQAAASAAPTAAATSS